MHWRLLGAMSPVCGEGSAGGLAKLERDLCCETSGTEKKGLGGVCVSLKPFMLCESFGSQKSLKGYHAACSLWVAVTWGKTSFA